MSQKELNYIEDAYNHEKLLISILNNELECLESDEYIDMFKSHIECHENMMKRIRKYMEGLC